jgi:hypothetical protein
MLLLCHSPHTSQKQKFETKRAPIEEPSLHFFRLYRLIEEAQRLKILYFIPLSFTSSFNRPFNRSSLLHGASSAFLKPRPLAVASGAGLSNAMKSKK